MRRKKTDRKKLMDQLDTVSKQLVKIRDSYTCQKDDLPVSGANCHVSHVIPVSYGAKLRWDLQNMKVLSYHRHINWWHKNPIEAAEWFKTKFPDRYAYLEANKGTYRWSIEELESMLANYTEQLEKAPEET